MHKTVKNNLKILLLVLSLIQAQNIAAEIPYKIQSNEVKLLPSHCGALSASHFEPDAYKIFVTRPKTRSIGPHFHHFCHGKKYIIRANNNIGNKKERDYALEQAVGEFEYILRRKNDLSNNYTAITSMEKARVLKRLNRISEAMPLYQQAIKYNPKLSGAYAGLSDIYKTQGMNEDAREILELGLKRIPKSKSLQRRLDKL